MKLQLSEAIAEGWAMGNELYEIYSPAFCSAINSLCKTETEEDAVWDFIENGMV